MDDSPPFTLSGTFPEGSLARVRPFEPAAFVRGAHLQTIWGSIVRSRSLAYQREVLTTPDGDELILDHLAPDQQV